jgi:hypothetical protein
MQQQGQGRRVHVVHALELVHGGPAKQFLDHGRMDGDNSGSKKAS